MVTRLDSVWRGLSSRPGWVTVLCSRERLYPHTGLHQNGIQSNLNYLDLDYLNFFKLSRFTSLVLSLIIYICNPQSKCDETSAGTEFVPLSKAVECYVGLFRPVPTSWSN